MKPTTVLAALLLCVIAGVSVAADTGSPSTSLIIDQRGDWTSPGADHSDIISASLTQVGDSFVFTMGLAGVVPTEPELYVSYNFPLDFGAGLGSIWVGCGCTDCARGKWNPAIGRWNEDWTDYTLESLPEDSFSIAYNTIVLVVPVSQLQAPSVFQWAADTHYDNSGVDSRDFAPAAQGCRWPGGIVIP